MRILVTSDAVGGVWDHSVTLTRQLVAGGHEVVFAVVGRASPERARELPGSVHRVGLDVPLEWMAGGIESARTAAEWIDRVAETTDAEIVHLNQLTYSPWIVRPKVVAVHGDAWSWFGEVRGTPPPGARWIAYREAVSRGLEAAGAVVAPSRYQCVLTERHYGCAVHRSIWNGIEPIGEDASKSPVPPPRPSEGPVRGIARPTLVTVGRAWDEAKGLEVLEDALQRLGGAWAAYVAGDSRGPEGQRFEAEMLLPLGRLRKRELGLLLGQADVYVAPALYEPFGLAVAEAAWAGCALVLSDIGSFREIWGEDALFFPTGDARALADVLEALSIDPGLGRTMGERARSRAWERFSAGRMAEEYLELYRALQGGARPGAGLETVGRARCGT